MADITITVTTLDDTTNGVGISLRDAIATVNANAGSSDNYTIEFDSSLQPASGTESVITLTQGEITISNDVIIDGDIDGDGRADIAIQAAVSPPAPHRIFNIDGGGSNIQVELNSLVLENGGTVDGGAVFVGDDDTLIALAVTFQNNEGARGGALFLSEGADAEIHDSVFQGNESAGNGGAIYADDADDLTIVNTTFYRNESTDSDTASASAIYSFDTNLTILNSTLVQNGLNEAANEGEYVALVVDDGSVEIKNTIISGNGSGSTSSAADNVRFENLDLTKTNQYDVGFNLIGEDPANIFEDFDQFARSEEDDDVATLVIQDGGLAHDTGGNSEVTTEFDARGDGNFRTAGDVVDIGAYEIQGNGPYFVPDLFGNAATVAITENTAAGINTPNGTEIFDVNAVLNYGDTVDDSISYSIVSGNVDVDGDQLGPFAIDSDTGLITVVDADDLDHDLQSSFTLEIEASGGGETTTANVTVNLSDLAETFVVTTLKDEFDVGFSVTNPGGDGLSLREALELANANVNSRDTIVFANDLEGTIRLKADQDPSDTESNGEDENNSDFGSLVYARNVIIDGDNRITISGDTAGNDVTTMHGDVEVTDLSQMPADSVLLDDNVGIFYSAGQGGSIGNINVFSGLTLTGGTRGTGGAIYGGSIDVLVHDSTLIGNQGTGDSGQQGGGALWGDGGLLYVLDSTLSGNRSANYGGAIAYKMDHDWGGFVVYNSTITDNYAKHGGAIRFDFAGTIYSDPNSENYNVEEFRNKALVLNSTIVGNYAEQDGGGLDTTNIVNYIVANSIVLGNESGSGENEIGANSYALGQPEFLGSNLIGEDPSDFNASAFNGVENASLADVFAALQTYDLTGLQGGMLADNGGNVWTMALKLAAANPALDAAQIFELVEADLGLELTGHNSGSRTINEATLKFDANGDGDTSDLLTGFDARGGPRPVDVPSVPDDGAKTADIGAFELEPSAPTDLDLINVNSVDENDDAGVEIGDVTVVDEDTTNIDDFTFTLSDDRFEVDGNKLQLKSGQALDYEVDGANFRLTITVTDPDDQRYSETFDITVNDVNEAPTAVSLTNVVSDLDEDADTSSRRKIADIVVTDDALGTNTLSLSGTDAASFEIDGTELYLKANTSLDHESKSQFDVTVVVDDTSVGSTPDATTTHSLAINDVNEAPTAVSLTNVVSDLDEDADTSSRRKIADIVVTDDALGTNTLSLSGTDAASFEIDGTELYLKANTSLDHESKSQFDVTVVVDDTSVGTTPDATTTHSLAINDVNEAPTVSLTNVVSDLDEDADTSSRRKIADIVVTDDALGTNTLSLSGTDAASFEIDGTELYLKANTSLDHESKSQFDVTVVVDDTSVGSTPDATTAHSLAINDVNEAPTAVSLTNVVSDLDEDADTSSRRKIADIVVTDDALGTNTLSLSGTDAASFEIDGTELYLKANTSLDHESKSQFDVTVVVDDTSVGSTPDATTTHSLAINDVNEAPTAVSLTNVVSDLDEDADTSSRRKIADIVVTDDALGTNTLSLSGTDAASFEIDGTELYLKANTSLDHESKSQFDVTVVVDDTSVGSTPDATTAHSLAINDVNEAPTAVSLTNVVSDLDEDADTSSRRKIADIVVTDDALGTNTLSLSGTDAASFEIDGTELYLKANTSLDHESKSQFDVTVVVDDTSVGSTPDATTTHSLAINDVNEAPTAVSLTNVVSDLDEDADTSSRRKIADIVVTDDALGTNTLSLSGTDAASFEIDGTELYLKANTSLDHESKSQFDVTVVVDDTSVGSTPDATTTHSLAINDVNEAPTAVSLTNVVSDLDEDADTSSRRKIADIVVTDDALGTNTLSLSGTDAASFEIDGTELYLKANTSLDHESKSQFDVTVVVDDTSVGSTPDATTTHSLAINDVNEAPTAVSLTNVVSDLDEDADTSSRRKIADIVVTDDALGTNTLSLSGTDAASFEIDGTELYLKANTSLDHESKSQFDVTVVVDDTSVGSTPDATTTHSLAINDVNEAPTAVSLTNVVSDLDEDADTSSRRKIADIVVTDDALGTNTLSLSGTDAASFEIDGTELYLKANTSLDHESKSQFDVTVVVDDTSVGSTPDATTTHSLAINDANEAPTAVSLTNVVSDLDEDADTSSRRKIADIVVTDDALGTNTLSLSGTDAASFEIDGTELYLKANTSLDHESKSQFDVTVVVDDTSVGSTPDATTTHSLAINDVNEAPTAVSLTNVVSDLDEDADTSSRRKIADIVVTDDALGTNTLSLSGTDAASFEIDGTELYLKANTSLDHESKSQFDVTVVVDDTSVGSTPDATTAHSLAINDVNEAPTAVSLTNVTFALPEDHDTTSRVKVADIVVTDDALGSNSLDLSGSDAGFFEIIGTELYLKAGTSLDASSKSQFDVMIEVDDTTVGSTPDATTAFSLQITDAVGNAAPTSVSLTNITSALAEDSDTTSRVKVADIVVTDDGLGTNDLSLSGADAGFFEIDGNELYLKAGTSLDYESKTQFDVTIEVDDPTVGATPDANTAFSLQITDVVENTPPTAVSLANVTFVLPDDNDTTSRVKIADILVADDGLGINTLGLSGSDAGFFEIDGTELFLKAGTLLDASTKTQFDVTVEVDDTTVGTTPDATTDFSLEITDATGNAAPTAVRLVNMTSALTDDTDTTSRVKVADIVVTDDGLGINDLSLSGSDAGFFEIDGTELYLKAGTSLDHESKMLFDVTINVDDASVGPTPDATSAYSLRITDAGENAPPTSVILANVTFVLPEDHDTTSRVKVADIVVTDDGVGINTLSLSGADADSFEIIGTELYLKAGTLLDVSTKALFDVTVEVDDTTVGTTPDVTTDFSLFITDAAGNAAPKSVSLTNVTSAVAENTDTTVRVKVADIVVTDDNLGTNNLSLSGADADFFEIDGAELYLKAGTELDFETSTQLDVTIEVDDPDVGPTPDANTAFTLEITNQPITDIEIESGGSVDENSAADTVVATFQASENPVEPLAQFRLIDDAGGLFYLDGNTLRVADGAQLDFESATQHTVVIGATDGTGPEISETFNIQINDVSGREIIGTPFPDVLEGTAEDDSILALASDDRILGSLGSDSINGGSGTDTVVYDGNRSDFELTLLSDGRITVLKPDGSIDTLTSIERIDLVDGDYVYDFYGPNTEFGYLIYQASFGRVPDEEGVRFWVDVLDALDQQGWTEYQKEQFLARQFIESDEFSDLYGTNPTNEDYINAMYQNVLGRQPDQPGYEFWLGGMEEGLTPVDILVAFTESDENVDRNADNLDDGIWVV